MASGGLLPPDGNMKVPSGSATGSLRCKVALRPGHSLMDWIRLTNSGVDLAGTGGKILRVTPQTLSEHNKPDDAWIAIRGVVYNVTRYIDFHPGGFDELMRGVGKDATELFNDVHAWVNVVSMLKGCVVGNLVSPLLGDTSRVIKKPVSIGANTLLSPPNLAGLPKIVKAWDWEDTSSTIEISLFDIPGKSGFTPNHVVVQVSGGGVAVSIWIRGVARKLDVTLEHPVEKRVVVTPKDPGRSVSLFLKKCRREKWPKLGDVVRQDGTELPFFDGIILESKKPVTHDSFIFTLKLPTGLWIKPPLGYHIRIKQLCSGVEIVRPYTPVPDRLILPANDESERLYFLIKVYPDGALTPVLDKVAVGESVVISHPQGHFSLAQISPKVKQLLCFAAGTGVTPIYGLLSWALHQAPRQRKANITTKLLFFNKTQADILLHSELLEVENKFSARFSVSHVLSDCKDSDWQGLKGRINKEMLEEILPIVDVEEIFIAVCGPTPFSEIAVKLLTQCGYIQENIHVFSG